MLGFLSPANRGGANPNPNPNPYPPPTAALRGPWPRGTAHRVVHMWSRAMSMSMSKRALHLCILHHAPYSLLGASHAAYPPPGLLTATILLFVLMGVPAGYFSAHTYKSVKGTEWKKATLMTAFLWPAVVVGAFFVLNFFIWGQASSGNEP